MRVIETDIKDVYVIEPQVFGDNRGWFMERWSLCTSNRTIIFFNGLNNAMFGQREYKIDIGNYLTNDVIKQRITSLIDV